MGKNWIFFLRYVFENIYFELLLLDVFVKILIFWNEKVMIFGK